MVHIHIKWLLVILVLAIVIIASKRVKLTGDYNFNGIVIVIYWLLAIIAILAVLLIF